MNILFPKKIGKQISKKMVNKISLRRIFSKKRKFNKLKKRNYSKCTKRKQSMTSLDQATALMAFMRI